MKLLILFVSLVGVFGLQGSESKEPQLVISRSDKKNNNCMLSTATLRKARRCCGVMGCCGLLGSGCVPLTASTCSSGICLYPEATFIGLAVGGVACGAMAECLNHKIQARKKQEAVEQNKME